MSIQTYTVVVTEDGNLYWYLNGRRLTEQEWKEQVKSP